MEVTRHDLIAYKLLNMNSSSVLGMQKRGFTLIEIVIVLVLLGILGVVGAKMISGSVYTNQMISNENQAYSSARYALERMSRNIREIQNTGVLQVNIWTSTELKFQITGPQIDSSVPFYVDFIYNPATGILSMSYSGKLSNGTVYDGTLHPLGKNLSNPSGIFNYYYNVGIDTAGADTVAASSTASINYVSVNLNIKPTPTINSALSLSTLIDIYNK